MLVPYLVGSATFMLNESKGYKIRYRKTMKNQLKQQLKGWLLRVGIAALIVMGLLLSIVLNPDLLYADETVHGNVTIYHNGPIHPLLKVRLDEVRELLKSSEFYGPEQKFDLCLNDGLGYRQIPRIIFGEAFGWGFYDKVVLNGAANFEENTLELNGYKWHLTQLLAHEMVHCMQFDKLGFWKSKPVARIPDWKWEGYAEYVSRQHADQQDLLINIERVSRTDKESWAVIFDNGTIAPRVYYDYWMMVHYCLDIKKMTYSELLADPAAEDTIRAEMMDWYKQEAAIL